MDFRPARLGHMGSGSRFFHGLGRQGKHRRHNGHLYGASGNVYATLGATFTAISGFSFLVFNLLCAPCFAAIDAIKREMNNAKWTWFAIAYVIALMINQFGKLFAGSVSVIGLILAVVLLAGMLYMLFRPYKESTKLATKVNISK